MFIHHIPIAEDAVWCVSPNDGRGAAIATMPLTGEGTTNREDDSQGEEASWFPPFENREGWGSPSIVIGQKRPCHAERSESNRSAALAQSKHPYQRIKWR